MGVYRLIDFIADRREFIKISQAVGIGFVVMGAIGILVLLLYLFRTDLCNRIRRQAE